MYVYLNLHPSGKVVRDCVKRAIACATGMDYKSVSLALNRLKKVTNSDSYNQDKNWKYYLENVLQCQKLSFPAEKGKPRMNGERFCIAYPRGRYVLSMAGHLTACVDGVIYDTWDCREKCVYTAWKVA